MSRLCAAQKSKSLEFIVQCTNLSISAKLKLARNIKTTLSSKLFYFIFALDFGP